MNEVKDNVKRGLVSVIIPIYNVEKYLDTCIESVVNQSYKNLEIVLVDDGSTDGSSEICNMWLLNDSRIKVIHKKNEGLGRARNSGMEVSNGEYLFFLDSDDYLEYNAIELLYDCACRNRADIVGSGELRIDDYGEQTISFKPLCEKKYVGTEIREIFIPDIIAADPKTGNKVGFGMNISGPLFSHEMIIRSKWRCRSERDIISEDVYSFLELCDYAKIIVELPVYTYYYRVNNMSLSMVFRKDRYEKIVAFYKMCKKLINEKGYGEEAERRIARPYLSYAITCLKQIEESSEENKIKKKMFDDIITDETLMKAISEYTFTRESINWKILFWAIYNKKTTLVRILIKIKTKGKKR